jgi:ATP-dependent exoDNAse (exonuclease V) alpha subunit
MSEMGCSSSLRSRDELEAFSAHSTQIEQALADRGLTRETATSSEKQLATLQTRKPKTSLDRDELFRSWQARAAELHISLERPSAELSRAALTKARAIFDTAPRTQAARDAVKFAINHLTERQALATQKDLIDTAVKHGVGRATIVDVRQEIDRRVKAGRLLKEAPTYRSATERDHPHQTASAWWREIRSRGLSPEAADKEIARAIIDGRLVLDEPRYTTPRALARENRILRIEKAGRNSLEPAVADELVTERLAATNLSADQRAAVETVVGSTNRVMAVQGFAGTGKSHALLTTRNLFEEAGFTVSTAAPYSGQVRRLREDGLKSTTVAAILSSRTPEKYFGPRSVMIVDEAGLVPARQMALLQALAEKHGTRLVLLGDTQQTKPIEAGRPFEQLQKAGALTARLQEVRRQTKRMLRSAVEFAARGDTRRSLLFIDDVHQVADASDRHQAIAAAFASLSPEVREKTIVVSGTNESRQAINELIREQVGTAGTGLRYSTLTRLDTTQEEREYAKYFSIGSVIQPERDYKRVELEAGKLYLIAEKGRDGTLTVREIRDGALQRPFSFNPAKTPHLSVYERHNTELAPGDRVRITRNDATRDLANGDRGVVREVTPEKVIVALKDREVALSAKNPIHLDLAYATTVHSAQGQTCDRVLVDLVSTSRTTTADVYYVAISRAREQAVIFTDDAQKLPKAIEREAMKYAALDLARDLPGPHLQAQIDTARAGANKPMEREFGA